MSGRKLSAYQAKRDFTRTQEPSGETAVKGSNRLRFVIQKHDATRLHYDLRLEWDGVFKSWAVAKGPSLDPHDKRLAVEVEDHPLDYGDFEGTIPKGEYGGGTVQLWDRGFWEPDGMTVEDGLANGDLKFRLDGERLHGGWVLVRMKRDFAGGKRNNWLLIKHRDDFASEGDTTLLAEDRSVASGRAMADIAAGKGRQARPFMKGQATRADAVWHSKGASALPDFVPPQLCRVVERPPAGDGWVHEIKFDGYRMQARIASGACVLRTRKGLDWTSRFSAIAEAAGHLPDAILDGEIVALDTHGAPDFAALQAALAEGHSENLVFFVFDLIAEGSDDLRARPLVERKTRLEALFKRQKSPRIRFVEHFTSGGEAVLKSACQLSLEGIVSKRADAPYVSGRSDSWTKAKCRAGHEVVIGGWTSEAGALRSLLVGVHRGDHFVYLGRVGTGFGQATAKRVLPRLEAVKAAKSPFTGLGAPKHEANITWAKPELVAEIEFAGWTGGGMVRQAAFKGLREDKPAGEVQAEAPAPAATKGPETPAAPPVRTSTRKAEKVMGVPITHPDKVMWDDAEGGPVTKLDLARYYEAIGSWIMPHLQGRPCSIVRAPDGYRGEQFFQRHAGPGTSNLLDVVTVSGDRKPYVEIDRVEGLAAVAQVAALELHPWNNRPGQLDQPGRLVFDLDPGPGVPFDQVIAAAKLVRGALIALDLVPFCKTTGGKGLHVVTPLAAAPGGPDWPAAKAFARLVCETVAKAQPDRFVTKAAKNIREKKIYLDYLRNDRMATAVAPLSPRARPGATVSMPLTWAQVRSGLDPQKYTIRTVPGLIGKSDAWQDYAGSERPLAKAIARLKK